MPHQQTVVPDPFEFSRRGEKLAGECDARSLTRLAGAILDTGDVQPVRYELCGVREDAKSFLLVRVCAELTVQCQRCLEPVVRSLGTESRLLLVPDGTALPDEDLEEDDFDPVHAGRNFDVLGAVEEELLLALPLAPMHESCKAPGAVENGGQRSPFAVLKGFRPRGGDEPA